MQANTVRRNANSGETATAGAPSWVRGRIAKLKFSTFNFIAHLLLAIAHVRWRLITRVQVTQFADQHASF